MSNDDLRELKAMLPLTPAVFHILLALTDSDGSLTHSMCYAQANSAR